LLGFVRDLLDASTNNTGLDNLLNFLSSPTAALNTGPIEDEFLNEEEEHRDKKLRATYD
jgi:hypothetical protein